MVLFICSSFSRSRFVTLCFCRWCRSLFFLWVGGHFYRGKNTTVCSNCLAISPLLRRRRPPPFALFTPHIDYIVNHPFLVIILLRLVNFTHPIVSTKEKLLWYIGCKWHFGQMAGHKSYCRALPTLPPLRSDDIGVCVCKTIYSGTFLVESTTVLLGKLFLNCGSPSNAAAAADDDDDDASK
jgi:hypothetical protein